MKKQHKDKLDDIKHTLAQLMSDVEELEYDLSSDSEMQYNASMCGTLLIDANNYLLKIK